MTAFPLFVLISAVAVVAFHRRGDRTWLAVGKGALVGAAVVTLLSLALAVTAGGPWRCVNAFSRGWCSARCSGLRAFSPVLERRARRRSRRGNPGEARLTPH